MIRLCLLIIFKKPILTNLLSPHSLQLGATGKHTNIRTLPKLFITLIVATQLSSKNNMKKYFEFGFFQFYHSLLDGDICKNKFYTHFFYSFFNLYLSVYFQAKLHYLDIVAGLPSYGAKCFSSSRPERVLLVSPRFGLSQIVGRSNSVVIIILSLFNQNSQLSG